MNETDGPDREELPRPVARARPRRLPCSGRPRWVARLLEDTMSHDVDTPLTNEIGRTAPTTARR